MTDSIDIKITVRVGDRTMTVQDRAPLFLGGDRRRWRRKIVDHITEQTEVIAARFQVPPTSLEERTTA